MTDIEKKAREYADEVLKQALLMYDKDASEFLAENAYHAYLQGMKDALYNQWRDAEKEKPEHNHLVLAEIEVDIPEIRFCTAYYQDGIWVTPDDFYYNCKVLSWLPILEYKPKGEQ